MLALLGLCGGIAKAHDHGISMTIPPQLERGYVQFGYTATAAIAGGQLREAKIGSFDNLNPFTIRGAVAYDIRELVFESLLTRNMDEPFALYGLIAQKVALSPDRSKMHIRLNKNAKFSDGKPITQEDIIFSLETLRDKGRPNHRHYYNQVASVEQRGENDVIFTFNGPPYDRELPLILGLMPILPRHVYQTRDIQDSSLEIPIGSGPYLVQEVDPSRRVVFRRNPDYWANNEASTKNRFNFDEIIHDYYRDEASAFEAFKAGQVDVWFETDALRWESGYDVPAFQAGKIIKETLPTQTPSGLNAFVMNTRRHIFANRDIRSALDEIFDFEWINKTLYAGKFTRTQSYFGNTLLSAHNRTATREEKRMLSRSELSNTILERGYSAPKSDGSGRDRKNRARALSRLEGAGLRVVDGEMRFADGQPFTFEILVQRRDHERLALAYQRMLKQLGIVTYVRLVDAAQYQRRLQNFDFDMIIYDYYASLSPGQEQNYYWSSEAADSPGSRNYAGIKSSAIDEAIAALTSAENYEAYQDAGRALDRALMGGHYFIPLFHQNGQWIARWQHIQRPENTSIYGAQRDSWWSSPDN